MPMLVLPLLWGRIRPTPMRAGALPKCMQPQASWAVPSSRSHGSSAGPCAQASPSQQGSDSPHHHSYTIQTQCTKGPAVAPPLSQAANKSRIDASVPRAHNLGSSSSGRFRCRCRRGGRRVKPSKCLPTEVEGLSPPDGASSPPNAGTPLSAYNANRPTTSSIPA